MPLPNRREPDASRFAVPARASLWRSERLLRRALVGALFVASVALIGCGARNSTSSTAPHTDAGVDTVNASVEIPATADLAVATTLGGPIHGLNAAEQARFDAGLTEFQDEDGIAEGLGPVFNENSCSTCHSGPIGGTNGRLETRFGRLAEGRFDPMTELGGSLLQDHAIGAVTSPAGSFNFVAEVVPATATVTAKRLTTPLFGLGLVDAVPDAELLVLAGLEARFAPTTAGTPSRVMEIRTGAMRVGRFGWKAQVPTLHQFSGDAYMNEMGVTNPEFPNENAPQGNAAALAFNPKPTLNDDGTNVAQFFDFMTLLGTPPRGPRTRSTEIGAVVFRQVGCANCHAPTLVTGASPVAALSYKTFHPYSDFLLHDMGGLGDGIVQGSATARQMRTAPLWGMHSRATFLHDGRATTPEAAILAHDGQGGGARDRFLRLTGATRSALLAFLGSL